MVSPSGTRSPSVDVDPSTRRMVAIAVGGSLLFVVFQYFTSGEFITDGIPKDTRDLWTEIHGFGAYPVMVFALVAAIIAFTRLRGTRWLVRGTALYFVATVVQWLLGHAISTLGMDALTPLHVVVAALVLGLGVWLSVRSARPRRAVAAAER